MPGHDEVGSLRRRRMRLHLFLAGGGLALLLLLLARLLLGVVTAVEAAGGGAERAVMTGIVTGDAADRRPFRQPLASADDAEIAASAAAASNKAGIFMTEFSCETVALSTAQGRLRFPDPRGPRLAAKAPPAYKQARIC